MKDFTNEQLEYIEQRIEESIHKFATRSGLSYDHPNPFENFEHESKTWSIFNSYTLIRLSVLAYQDVTSITESLLEIGAEDVCDLSIESSDTQGFGCVYGGSIYLSFRGTESLQDVITDAKSKKINFSPNQTAKGKVHSGFLGAANSIAEKVKQYLSSHKEINKIWLTGHSLGAAIALITAARISQNDEFSRIGGVYTFGQPRVGDKNFRREVYASFGTSEESYNKKRKRARNRIFRVFSCADPVPMLPRVGYEHVGMHCYITKKRKIQISPEWKLRYIERGLTWFLIYVKLAVGSSPKAKLLEGLISEHYSKRYLAIIRENLYANQQVR